MSATATAQSSHSKFVPSRPDGVRLLGDSPVTEDLLGYGPYVEALGDVLAAEDLDTPFTVGIFGRWGTGKSTFMAMLRRRLRTRGSGGAHTLVFQPWQFEEKQEIWQALLLSALRYLEKQLMTVKGQAQIEVDRLQATISTLVMGVGKLALDKAIGALSAGLVSGEHVLAAYADTQRDNTQFINTFRSEFKRLRNEILALDPEKDRRMFVFVDDLDRCTPDNCVAVLEAIKLFFDFSGCVFVIGIDRDVVQRGIEHKYKDSIRMQGQDYLDKMIQLPFSLPPITRERFQGFVRQTTGGLGFDECIHRLLTEASGGNPRRLKRLSNCLQLVRTVALSLQREARAELEEELNQRKLALLLMLQVRYPIAFAWLSRNPLTLDELEAQWADVQTEGRGLQRGYRAQLVASLEGPYGRSYAEATADRFLTLWRFAHEGAGVEPFSSQDQVAAYLGLAGVVEEDRAAAERALLSKENADDAVDSHYAGETGKIPMVDPPTRPKAGVTSEQRELIQRRVMDRVEGLVTEWEALTNRGAFSSVSIYFSLQERGQSLIARLARELDKVDDMNDAVLSDWATDYRHIVEFGRRKLEGQRGAVQRLFVFAGLAVVLTSVVSEWYRWSDFDPEVLASRVLHGLTYGQTPLALPFYLGILVFLSGSMSRFRSSVDQQSARTSR